MARTRAQNVGLLFGPAHDFQLHARFRKPCASKRTTLIRAMIAATNARKPCHSVMVNRGLKLMHKQSYVALRSARRRLGAAAQSTSNSARLEPQCEFALRRMYISRHKIHAATR